MKRGAIKIAAIYTTIRLLWIALSDRFVFWLHRSNDVRTILFLSSAKGFFYVIFTAFILYKLINRNTARIIASEQQYRSYFEANPTAMFIMDLATLRIISVNDAAIKQYGYGAEEFLTLTAQDIRPSADHEKLTSTLKNLHDGINQTGVWRHNKKDGSIIYVDISSNLMKSHDNKHVMVMAKDVTTQLLYEQQLEEANVQLTDLNKKLIRQSKILKEAQDISKLGGWQLYMDTMELKRSEGIYNILDFADANETEPMANFIAHLHPDDREHFIEKKALLENHGIDMNMSLRVFNDNGSMRYIHQLANMKYRDGKPYRIDGSMQDITESKEKDILLKNALNRYDLVALATEDMLYEFDIVNNKVSYAQHHGYFAHIDMMSETDPSAKWLSLVHPADVAKVIAANQGALANGAEKYQCEYRMDCGKGNYRYVADQACIVYDENKKALRMIGAVRDIHALKMTSDENRQLGEIVNKISNMVMITDVDTHVTWVNHAFEKFTGYSLKELRGLRPAQYLHGENTDPLLVDEIAARAEKWTAFSAELPIATKSGGKLWATADFTPLFDSHNEPKGYITIYSDISSLKEKEESIIKQNMVLRDIAWNESHTVRKPLATILGLIELMRVSTSEDKKQTCFEYINISALELDDMIREQSSRIDDVSVKGG
jgi:PAS domain S-box-containing protein